MFTLFYIQLLKKPDFEIWEYCKRSKLAILEWYLTWSIKYARISLLTHFQCNIYCLMLFQLTITYLACIQYRNPYVAQNIRLKSHNSYIT